MSLFMLSLLTVAFSPVSSFAEVYQYEDEGGSIHFTNVPTDPEFRMIVPPAGTSASSSKRSGKYSATDFKNLVKERSYRHGMDPDLVEAVIQVESDYNPRALSPKGAQGLMQLMPETARDLGVIDPFDPAQNIDGGVRYLRYLMDFFGWDLDRALAAYNAGVNRVVRYGDVPPITETKSYVRKVKQTYNKRTSPSGPAAPAQKSIYKVFSETGEVVFTNTPEAYTTF
jgi:soluble lytic murein transglycosylase